MNMKTIVSGLAIEYQEEGNGPAAIFLHGWKDDLHSFDPLIPHLSPHFKIVRLDLPGFGESELPRAPWKLDDYVDIVAAFVEKRSLHPAILLGHSLGGRICIKGVSRGVLRAEKIILIASAGVADRNTVRNQTLKVLAKVGKIATLPLPRGVRHKLRETMYKKIRSDYADAGELRETLVNILKEDLSLAAKSMRAPTLLIWGSADTETPLEEGVRLSELIEGAVLDVVQAAGHFVHRENPARVAELILRFAK